jgi:hypothetical protein
MVSAAVGARCLGSVFSVAALVLFDGGEDGFDVSRAYTIRQLEARRVAVSDDEKPNVAAASPKTPAAIA